MLKLVILFAVLYAVYAAEESAEPAKTEVQDAKAEVLPAAPYKPYSPYPAFPYQTPFADPYIGAPLPYQPEPLGYPYYPGYSGNPGYTGSSGYPYQQGYYGARNQRFAAPYPQTPIRFPGVQNAHVIAAVPSAYYNQAYVPQHLTPRPTQFARSLDS